MNRRLLALGLTLPLFGCARPQLPSADVAEPNREAPAEPSPTPAPEEPTPAPEPTPEPISGETVQLEVPSTGEMYTPGQPVEIRLTFGSGAGKGALVIVDSGAPRLVEPGATSLTVGALPQGPHVIRAVALDDEGMSLADGGLAGVTCQVGEGEAAPSGFDPAGPLVTVAEPFANVALPASGEVPFDVRVDHATLGEGGAKLKWQVDDGDVDWLAQYPPAEPLSLGRLETGKHTLTVWLVNADDVPMDNGGYSRVRREFTVPAAGGAG